MPAVVVHHVSARRPAVGEVDEGLAGEEVVLDVVHDPFDARLVGRGPHPGGVDDEAPGLGVLEEDVVEPGGGVLGLDDDRLHVVGDDDGEHAAEEAPGRLEAPDHLLGGLGEGGPDELWRLKTGREDESVAHARFGHRRRRARVGRSRPGARSPAAGRRRGPWSCAGRPRSARRQKRARVRGGTTMPRRSSRIPIFVTVRSSFTHAVIRCSSPAASATPRRGRRAGAGAPARPAGRSARR